MTIFFVAFISQYAVQGTQIIWIHGPVFVTLSYSCAPCVRGIQDQASKNKNCQAIGDFVAT